MLAADVMAATLTHRLLHHCHVINGQGPSYPLRQHCEFVSRPGPARIVIARLPRRRPHRHRRATPTPSVNR